MNMNQGGSFNNPRDGVFNPIRPVINSELDKQIEATTKRLNEIQIAKNKIKAVAQESGVSLESGELGKLAGQTVTNTEKELVRIAKEKIALKKEELALWLKQAQLTQKLKENNNNIEASAGAKAQIAMEQEALRIEKERIAAVRERNAQEEEGARIVIGMKREQDRIDRQQIRDQQQAAREQERIALKAKRERAGGFINEAIRDSRRNIMYGAIGRIEEAGSVGFKADIERSDTQEFLRQAGRSKSEIEQMTLKAQQLSHIFPTLTVSELMQLQQHNIGAVGSFEEGEKSTNLSAAYIAQRKQKVGEEQALNENQALQKVGEEKGKINDPKFMHDLYDQAIRISQVEGNQFEPEKFLTMTRMLKSSKFGLDDKQFLHIMPYLGIAEGMGRAGNEVAMFMKSSTYTGPSLSKQTRSAISGTEMSDGKGGYNPKMAEYMASGNLTGLIGMVNKFLTQKGLDTDDRSTANINKEIQALAPMIANSSAREAMITMVENRGQFEKQDRQAAGAQGLDASINIPLRTITGALDAVVSQWKDFSASALAPFNDTIIRTLNGVAVAERWGAEHPGGAGAVIGLTAAGIGTAFAAAYRNPQAAANTASMTTTAAMTTIIAGNTSASKLGQFFKNIDGSVGGGGRTGGKLMSGAIALGEFAVAASMTEKAGEGLAEVINQQESFGKQGISWADEATATWALLTGDTKSLAAQMQKAKDQGRLHLGSDKPPAMSDTAYHEMLMDSLNRNSTGRGLPTPKQREFHGKLEDSPNFHHDTNKRPWEAPVGQDKGEGYRHVTGSPNIWSSQNVLDGNTISDRNTSSSGRTIGRSTNAFDQPLPPVTVTPLKLDTSGTQSIWDQIKSAGSAAGNALGEVGSAVKSGLSGLETELSGAGGGIVSALNAIKGEIESIHMPTSVGSTGASIANGPHRRGPQ
jgi:hypothetical protein